MCHVQEDRQRTSAEGKVSWLQLVPWVEEDWVNSKGLESEAWMWRSMNASGLPGQCGFPCSAAGWHHMVPL